MKTTDLIHDFSSLPPEAQREVADFVTFLKNRYPSPRHGKKSIKGNLSDEPFIGMWQDREDMRDSTAWVHGLRREEWNPKK
jgi:hypothetical protein